MTAQVSVFRRRGRVFVQVFARSGSAWREADAQALPDPLSTAQLGAAVRSALRASAVARAPGRWQRYPAEGRLPGLAGVTSWIGFARGAVGVSVSAAGGELEVVPLRREGGSFADLVDAALRPPHGLDVTDDEALGAAVEDGLARAG